MSPKKKFLLLTIFIFPLSLIIGAYLAILLWDKFIGINYNIYGAAKIYVPILIFIYVYAVLFSYNKFKSELRR